MPNDVGFPIHVRVIKAKLEVSMYELVRSMPDILASYLINYHISAQRTGLKLDLPQDIAGHRLLFESAERGNNVWWDLGPKEKLPAYLNNLFCSIQFGCANLLSRPVFSLVQSLSTHHCSTLIPRSTLPLFGSANASLNRSLNRSRFPLLLHASSTLDFIRLRSKRQSAT